ncbi:MAG TPA: hypothetical protein VFB27_12410 [Opitutaceae bacterium]|nr:hypothetical protein [Opitutaceae bacterium]
MAFESFLDAREQSAANAEHQRRRDAEVLQWLNRDQPPEDRLIKFDAWIRQELIVKLDWCWAGTGKHRRIEQCRLLLEGLVLDLWKRGWMLDGRALKKHLDACLDDAAAAQKAGRVKEFWPFFSAIVNRYVGTNAEELKMEAISAGAYVGQIVSRLGISASPQAPTLPDLVAQRHDETLREKLARKRRKDRVKKEDESMPQLF